MTAATPNRLRLYLIRHGETEWSRSGRHTGLTDVPLTAGGEADARELGKVLQGVPFAHVFTSPRQRARRTCELVDLGPSVQLEADLAEWDYGDYEGRRTADIRLRHPDWNLYRDGSPHGETPAQALARADRLFARLRPLSGNVALFTHGQFGGVLAARWIGLPVAQAEHFPLRTASLSILSYAVHHPDVPVVDEWNGTADANGRRGADLDESTLGSRRPAIARWENEGGATLEGSAKRVLPKRLVVFDLDGTIAESKAAVDPEMAGLLGGLLQIARVAIISGGNWPQFQKQVVSHLPPDANLKALSLLPTCGTKFYRYKDDWDLLYSEDFGLEEKNAILAALKSVVASSGVAASRTWGEVIEDRGSQITFSALGQEAPLDKKKEWDPDFAKRKRMKALLGELIPEFSVRLGGTTSIDITKPGIDKAYGIKKLRDLLGISIEEMIFIGDALFPGGNDYPAKEVGVVSVRVRDSLETKRLIETLLACSSGVSRAGDDASDTLKVSR
jgi:phosphomannomutase